MRATLQGVGVLLAAAQAAIVGVAVVTGSAVLTVLAEIALLAVVGVVAVAARYRALRQRFAQLRRDAADAVARQRLSDEVHDLIGHELSLIGLQAGLLEMSPDPEVARRGAAIRHRAAEAVATLHDTIRRLDEDPGHDDLQTVIARSVEAGAEISVTGTESWTPEISRMSVMVVREGLTNAARHAPGRAVHIHLGTTDDTAVIEVVTHLAADADAPTADGRGITALRRRLDRIGGEVFAETTEGVHRLTTRIPLADPVPAAASPRPSRKALAGVLREAALPLAVTAALTVGVYVWSTAHSTIDDTAVITVGMSRSEAIRALPPRQAPVRLIRSPARPASWDCRVYSNGNFPLGMATVQICLDGDRVVRVTDLAEIPLL
ncbi:MAG: histidine kinase [Gordonia paraffinivorans]